MPLFFQNVIRRWYLKLLYFVKICRQQTILMSGKCVSMNLNICCLLDLVLSETNFAACSRVGRVFRSNSLGRVPVYFCQICVALSHRALSDFILRDRQIRKKWQVALFDPEANMAVFGIIQKVPNASVFDWPLDVWWLVFAEVHNYYN